MIKMIQLTKEQFLKVGQEIMADPRCDAEVKADVMRSVSGEEINGLFNYYTSGGSAGREMTWYDLIAIAAAK